MTREPWPKILVVDDQQDMLSMVYWTIETALPEAVVHCARNGVEALGELYSFRPHVIVTDLRMPGMIDGFALCERVAADRGLSGAKILVITGDGSLDAWRGAFERGAAEYLRKPFPPDALIGALRRLLGEAELSHLP